MRTFVRQRVKEERGTALNQPYKSYFFDKVFDIVSEELNVTETCVKS